MHNTSSQLYNYVSNLVIDFFSSQKIQPGERFNFYLEHGEDINFFYEAFRNNIKVAVEKFSYTHPEGGEVYTTFCLVIDQVKVIIAPSTNASEDYFTMLRNKVAEQSDIFNGTAILILFSGKLDSLSGGSSSLTKEGMPLHYSRFKKKIETDIEENTILKKHEKIILKSVLVRKTKSVVEDNSSIFDYDQVLNSLIKGCIELEDYRFLGLFPHAELISKDGELDKDLVLNFNLFEKYENIFLHGNPLSDLEQLLPDSARSKVIKEPWYEFDFTTISNWMEKEKGKKPPVFQGIDNDNIHQKIWFRQDGDSISKKRNINIIAFNPSLDLPFKISVKYDQFIKKDGINIRLGGKNLNATNSGFNINIEFREFDSENLFSLIEYKDEETDNKYLIRILHLPFSPNVISNFEGNFQLNVQKSSSFLQIKESQLLIFNPDGDIPIEEELRLDATYIINISNKLTVNNNYSLAQEDLIYFRICLSDVIIPIAFKTDFEMPKPITGIDVWKEKRINKLDFKFLQEETSIKLLFKNTERTVSGEFRNNLIQEAQIIKSDGYSWILGAENTIYNNEIELNEEIKLSFDNLKKYYAQNQTQPSLTFLSEELKQLSTEYVSCFIKELENIEESKPLNRNQKSLLWLGVVKEQDGEGKVMFTPLHPLIVAYQLQLYKDIKDEEVYNAILKRLSPYNLIPFIEGRTNQIFIPIDSSQSPEWLYYTVYLNSKQATPKSYVADLVCDKIKDYTSNFDFLFNLSKKSPIKINVINLGDCKEVVEGIFDFYKKCLNSNSDMRFSDLIPVVVSIYGSENIVTKFEEITFYESVDDIEKQFKIDLRTKNFGKEDLLNYFLENVKFFSKKQLKETGNYEYSHISFYQFDIAKTEKSYDEMGLVKTGISFNGLISDVCSTPRVQNYRTGFGMLDLPDTLNELTKLACLFNAFARVASNGDPYERNKALCTTINNEIKVQLEKLYINSQWVTYIDPKVDLDFFKENKELVIIHYSDQYNNSNGYDAITVSRKTNQYEFIVKEFLEKHEVKFDSSDDTIQIINFFNAINGEWLLKLIRQHSHFPKEKLSLLSGIKSALTFLNHPNIIWIPISLEEILRVSGNAGLNMGDGLFSTKNLGAIGSYCDDLLFVGLELFDGKLLMHIYPIELKIGGSGIVKKGIDQGRRTANLLNLHLNKEGFLGEFYKNFFAKIALVNADKMRLFHVWDTQKWDTITKLYRKDLLNNNFVISNRLNNVIGSYGLIYFGNDLFKRKINISDGYMHVELLETDGYKFLIKSIDDLIDLFHNTETTIDKKSLLLNRFTEANNEPYTEITISSNGDKDSSEDKASQDQCDTKSIPVLEMDERALPVQNEAGISIVFGTELNNSKTVTWEPNNTNKVMHTNTGIIGTMGTGKTQFTKSLITQLNENTHSNIGDEKLGILIFDYKGDYIKDDFVTKNSAIVLEPFHLPYNPLALDANESSKPMLPLHTANELKETIANSFNLGNVQKQRLRDVIVEAYENSGISKTNKDSWMLTPPTLGDVCDIYLNSEKNSQDSLYSAISNLSEFEIFEPDASKTKSLYSLIEGVVIINLSGYDESIQNLIVAITLDAFYSQMQKHGHSKINGHNRQIKKMILVDEADNFLSKNFNSIRKILKEGREFGVGTILSTQFLNHFATSENEYSNYILTWVIHRVNEIKMKEIESLFSLDNKLQKENLIKTIKGLEKHQSIVNLAGSEPILIKDKAFWELLNKQN